MIRNGKPVTGVAFDSIGRYAQSGLLRERFIPRLTKAKPEEILDASGAGIDTDKALRVMMRNEKPGGHGDRAHAVAAVELALWDLNAKLAGVPAWKLIADKFGVAARERMPRLRRRRLLLPGGQPRSPQGRDEAATPTSVTPRSR